MGTLIVNFVGVNAYVPHQDLTKLLVVMPNASKLGKSPQGALDGTPLKRHLPCLWRRVVNLNGDFSVIEPKLFIGSRLTFEFDPPVTTPNMDLEAIRTRAANGWLATDPALLNPSHEDRLAGQVLLETGSVALHSPPMPCNMNWNSPLAADPVVPGLSITIHNLSHVRVHRKPWIVGDLEVAFDEDLSLAADPVELFIGNQCAEDILDWPHNSTAPAGRTEDLDFRWIYNLSGNASIRNGRPLAIPVVEGRPIHQTDEIVDAFDTVGPGGGGAACECNGCVDNPQAF